MTKKGLSGDMVLQIGLLAIAAFTTLMAVNLFYDSVEVSVFGDPYLAAKTMSSYTDFVDASPVPMTIYHEIPQDFAGNPGYGSVLYNPENCEFLVNKYPQDYMSEVILNHAWDTITLEEALSIYALNKWNKKFGKNAAGVAAKSAAGSAIGEAMAKKERQLENQIFTDSIERQGYNVDELLQNARAVELNDALNKLEVERTAAVDSYIKEVELLQKSHNDNIKQANKAYVSQLDEIGTLGGSEISSKMADDFPYTFNEGAQRWQWKAKDELGRGGQFVSTEIAEREGKTILKNNAFISNQNTLTNLNSGHYAAYDALEKQKGERLGLADDSFEKVVLNKQFTKEGLEEWMCKEDAQEILFRRYPSDSFTNYSI